MTEEKPKIVHVHLPTGSGFKTTLTSGDHTIIADEPEYVQGGTDAGPDPYDFLLMALGSCTVMTLRMYAKRKDWPLEDVYVELRHSKRHAEDCKQCPESSAKLDHIEKEVILKGELSDEQRKKLVELSEKCPVHRTLMEDITIETILQKN